MAVNSFCAKFANRRGMAYQCTPDAPSLLVEDDPLDESVRYWVRRYLDVVLYLLSMTCVIADLYPQGTFFLQIARRTYVM